MAMLDGLQNYFARKAREDAIMATGGQLTADQYALLTPEQQKALRMQRYSSVRNNISQADLATNYQAQQEKKIKIALEQEKRDAMNRLRTNPNTPPTQADFITIFGADKYLTNQMTGGSYQGTGLNNGNIRGKRIFNSYHECRQRPN